MFAQLTRWLSFDADDVQEIDTGVGSQKNSDDLFAILHEHRDEGFQQRLNSAQSVYVDYAGAGLATSDQLRAITEQMLAVGLANPHSAGAELAQRAGDRIDAARERVLRHFHVDGTTHSVIFTAKYVS